MAEPVVQQFVADDAQYIRALEKQIAAQMRKQQADERAAKGSRKAAEDELRGFKQQEAALDALIRKWQAFKLARDNAAKAATGGMIPAPYSPNWTYSSRGGGMIPTTNFHNVTPPSAGLGGLIVRGADGALSHVGEAQQTIRMASLMPMIMRGLVSQVGGIITGFLAVETAIKAVNYQLEVNILNQKNAADAHKALAQGHAEIVLNTFNGTPATRQRYIDAAQDISSRTGLKEGLVASTLGRQAGRGVNLSPDQIIGATDIAAQLTRHTPDQFQPTASGIQQIMRIGGVGPKQAASLFQSAAAAAYPGDPALQARMIQQAIASGIANSPAQDLQTIEEIAEFTSTASQLGGEERGEAARTAMASLIAQLEEFRNGRGPWARQIGVGGITRTFHPKISGLPTHPREAFEAIAGDKNLSRRFWDKATFERQYEGILRDMLENKGGRGAQILSETQQAVGVNVPALEEQVRAINSGTPQLKVSGEAAKSEVRQQNVNARKSLAALRNEAYTIREDFMTGTSNYAHGGEFSNMAMRRLGDLMNVSPIESRSIGEIKSRIGMIGGFRNTENGARQVELGEQQIKRLEEIAREIRELRKAKPVPSAAPAANAEISYGRSGSW